MNFNFWVNYPINSFIPLHNFEFVPNSTCFILLASHRTLKKLKQIHPINFLPTQVSLAQYS